MSLFQFFPLIILIGVVLISLLFGTIINHLKKKDLQIDYSTKKIPFFIQNINGIEYLYVPYLLWQMGKLNAIKELFSDSIQFQGKNYKIILLYTNQPHLRRNNDRFPQFLYRDCLSVIELIDPRTFNYGNISNTYINGNSNQVFTQQNNHINIKNEIEKFIHDENSLSDVDKSTLEAFLYQLSKGSPQKNSAQKVIEILNKFIPFTTAIINMIKALYF